MGPRVGRIFLILAAILFCSRILVFADQGLSITPRDGSFSAPVGGRATRTYQVHNGTSMGLNVAVTAMTSTGQGQTGSGGRQAFIAAPSTVFIGAGKDATVTVTFAPPSAGAYSGELDVSAPDIAFDSIQLTGTASSPSAMFTASPSSLEFGPVPVNTSVSRTVSLTYTAVEAPPLNISVTTDNGVFTASSNKNPLAAGDTAIITVTFTPPSPGGYSATLTITGQEAGCTSGCPKFTTTVQLSGVGVLTSSLTVSPPSLDFGTQLIGSVTPGVVTLTSSGKGQVTIRSISITGPNAGDFAITSDSGGSTLQSGERRTLTISFQPTAPGPRTAALVITSSAGVTQVPLNGSGTLVILRVEPTSLSFGNQPVGSLSSQSVTLTNIGSAPMAIQSLSLTNTRDFIITGGGSGGTVPAGLTGTITVAFTPQNVGSTSGTLIITTSAGTFSVALSGTGTAPVTTPGITVSPTSLDFTPPASSTQTVTITSSGTGPLTIRSISLTGPDAGRFAITTDSGGSFLQPGQQRQVSISFASTTTGSFRASLTIDSNAPGSPHSVALAATLTTLATGGPVQKGSAVGDAVNATGRLEIFGADPPAPDSAVTAVTGVGDDGSLFVLDYAGSALLRVPPQGGPAQILLDVTRQTVPGGVGLARLLQVKTSRSGVHAIQALLADNTRAIFRLDQDTLALLASLPESRRLTDLGVGDAGQIAYIAPLDATPGSPLGLFLALRGQSPRLLARVGDVTSSGLIVTGMHDLQVNGAAVLTYIMELRSASGAAVQAVMRGTSTEQVGVAVTGRAAPGLPGLLTAVQKPRIGPNGTIVFQGSGAPPQSVGPGFVNFFADGPGRTLAPLLRPANWSTADNSFDYDVAANGEIAIRAALPTEAAAADSELYRVSPTGNVDTVVSGRPDIQPAGQPAFGPDNRLFFLGQNLQLPRGRNTLPETGLYRSRRVGGELGLDAVAIPDQPVPGWTGVRLLGITQRPVVTANDLVFGVLFGGPESLPVPTAALFRVPFDDTLREGLQAPEGLIAPEGKEEAEAGRLAMLRDLSYRGDQTLVFYGLLPGAGPVVAPSTTLITIASVFRTQALRAGLPISPLLATGDNLAGAGQLENTLPPLVPLGPDRELFVARTSRSQTPPRLPDNEGLFTVRSDRLVEPAAVTRLSTPGASGATFNGFADIKALVQPLGPPSVGTDGRVVFKALLNVNNQPQAGIFQWSPGAQPLLIRGPESPEALMGWAAGRSGVNFVLERSSNGSTAQLLMGVATSLLPVATLGVTPDMLQVRPDAGVLLVTNANGDLFVVGMGPNGGGVYRLEGNQLRAVAIQGSTVSTDRNDPGFNFTYVNSFEFAPDSARGDLIFRATAQRLGGAAMRGEFELDRGQSVPFTRNIGSLDLTSARTLSIDPLGTTMPVQSRNGISVSARLDVQTNSWSLIRFQVSNGRVSQAVIAQDKKGDRNSRFAALDTGALLAQEADVRTPSGPVFTINDTGSIAFLASDGQSWGIYQVPAR